MTLPSAPAAPAPAQEPTHGCVRCGAPIPISESMCERCNPLGLKAPAASQAHGIAIVGVAIGVVVLAVVARLVIADVGPFEGSVTAVVPEGDRLRVSISVANAGSSAGSVTCRIDDPAQGGIGPDAVFVQSPEVPGEGTVTFDALVATFGLEPIELTADCGS